MPPRHGITVHGQSPNDTHGDAALPPPRARPWVEKETTLQTAPPARRLLRWRDAPTAARTHTHTHAPSTAATAGRRNRRRGKAAGSSSLRRRRHRLGEADAVVAKVVDREVLREEDVAEDPERASRLWYVHRHQPEGAHLLAEQLHLQHVLSRLEGEGLAAQGERERGQLPLLVARNRVLPAHARLRVREAQLANHLLQLLGGADDERGARVGDGGALCEDVASADRHCVEVELPVALACDGEVVEVAGVVGVVDAAQEEHAARRLLRVLAHPKGEERRRELALLDQLLHHRREAVDRERRVGEAEDAVEL
mmetsp:Transcript_44788/g.138043  ORF Transcript_44788/g.138043 Transcript_44788/m.138043 type:complete len:311 (-) Transcript_44788:860-1792(-)